MAIRDYANKKKKNQYDSRTKAKGRISSKKSRGRKTSSALTINVNPMLVLVLGIGLVFLAAIVYIEFIHNNNNITNTATTQARKDKTANSEKKVRIATKSKGVERKLPKFEFYHTLPKMEVAINKIKSLGDIKKSEASRREDERKKKAIAEKIKILQEKRLASTGIDAQVIKNVSTNTAVSTTDSSNTTLSTAPTATKSTLYSLQLASFKDIDDAEQLKAKLILDGYDIKIQTVSLANGEIWHRVKTGKIHGLDKANALSAKLTQYNIKSMLVIEKS